MSDDIPSDVIKKRLVLFLRIPSETWTDVLAMLPRRILAKNISPTCYRLKEISDKNVKNVHVTRSSSMMFAVKLEMNRPEAVQQLAHLAANKCPLAGQFRVTEFWVLCEKSKEVLRHCLDLLQGCRISLNSRSWDNAKSATLTEQSLSILEANKPSKIDITICGRKLDQFNNFWQHPTVLNSSRIEFEMQRKKLTQAYANAIFQWLHHQTMPTGVDGDGTEEQPDRCLIIHSDYYGRDKRIQGINWLLGRCIRNFQQSKNPSDRRRFVLSISALSEEEIRELDQFGRHENQKTGEVLLLEPAGDRVYRYRRCLAEEVANGEEFYAKTFDRNISFDEFVGNDAPLVEIQNG